VLVPPKLSVPDPILVIPPLPLSDIIPEKDVSLLVPTVSVLLPRSIEEPLTPERSVIVVPPFVNGEISNAAALAIETGVLLIEPDPES